MQSALYTRAIDRAIVRFDGREYRGEEEKQGEGTDKGIEYLEFALIYFPRLEGGNAEEWKRGRGEEPGDEVEGILSESRACFIESIRSPRIGKVNKRARVPHELNLNR